jgi:trehalose 6-phosphate synthase
LEIRQQARTRDASDIRHVILASDRGPITFRMESGTPRPHRPSGSVTDVLDAAARSLPFNVTWLAATSEAQDHAALAGNAFRDLKHVLGYRFVPIAVSKDEYNSYYYDASVRLLWFAYHDLWSEIPVDLGPSEIGAFEGAFSAVNRRFVQHIVDQSEPQVPVIFHDYQLALAPGMLRRLRPKQPVALFSHTAFASTESLAALPNTVVRRLLSSMLSADLLGFQRATWARRFMKCCEQLLGASIDWEGSIVRFDGRATWVRCYPLVVDNTTLRAVASAPSSRQWDSVFNREQDKFLIARVERLDPSKNTVRGLQSFELLLESRLDDQNSVRLVACLIPSRVNLPEYQWYRREMYSVVRRIESRYPGSLKIYWGHDRSRALALLRRCDVLFVNPLLDGMNLVAQEGVLLNNSSGALVLSPGAGCADLLSSGPVFIEDVFNAESTAHALATAIALPTYERKRRMTMMRDALLGFQPPASWLESQVQDLDRSARGFNPSAAPVGGD